MRNFFGTLGVVGILMWACVIVGAIGMSIYGLILAFSASIVLGILTLFVEPAPFIFGAVMFFAGTNLPQKIMNWYNTPDSVKVSVEIHK